MNVDKLLHTSKVFLKKNAPTILTCVGGVGVVATAVMAVKATPKALTIIEQAEEEKGEKLTKLEVVQVAGPSYIPAIITGAATIACVFGANTLNKHQQAALMSAYALLDSSYKDYKKKVEELYGEDANATIRQELAKDKYEEIDIDVDDNKILFYDDYSKRYFESTMEDVLRAEYEINKKLVNQSGAFLNEFYEMLDIPAMPYGETLGWSTNRLNYDSWSSWLDFFHQKVVMDDGLECYIITFSSEPICDFEYY